MAALKSMEAGIKALFAAAAVAEEGERQAAAEILPEQRGQAAKMKRAPGTELSVKKKRRLSAGERR